MTIKETLILLLLTIVMGYILGLMISTTVNYKLNDIMVNMPRPVVKLGGKSLSKIKGKKIKEGFTSKIDKKSKKNKNPIRETFENPVENVPNKAVVESSNTYNNTLKDQNMLAYARLFNINDKNIQDDELKFTYSAYNKEDTEDNYHIVKPKKTDNKLDLIDSLKKSINKVKNIIPRKKRKSKHNCQKQWHNCSSSHKVVLDR